MPVVAILGAGFALAAGGAAAIGATAGMIAGTVAFSLTTVFEAVGAIGATLGAVGSITHDKGLQTAGLIMGGVGGIGALASSAGLFGANATVASALGTDAEAVTVTPMNAGIQASEDALNGINPAMRAAATTADRDIVNSLGGLKPDLGLPTIGAADQVAAASGNATALLPKVTDATASSAMPQTVGLNAPSPTTGIINGSAQAQVNAAEGLPATIPGVAAPTAPVTGTPIDPNIERVNVTGVNPAFAPSSGILGALKNFIGDDSNGMVRYGLLQAGGALLGGATDTLKPAQVDALAAQAAQNRAATQLSLTQQSNLAAPIPVARRAIRPNITGAPMPGGIINSTPQAVTGAIA